MLIHLVSIRDYALDYLIRKVDKTRENNPSTKNSLINLLKMVELLEVR